MKKSKRAMRRAILSDLFEHLEEYYGCDWSRDTFVDGQLSLHQIDALLAFKSDPRLEELRGALVRLEDGTYGTCIGCKHDISQEVLDRDPTQRVCSECEWEFTHSLTPDFDPHVSYLR